MYVKTFVLENLCRKGFDELFWDACPHQSLLERVQEASGLQCSAALNHSGRVVGLPKPTSFAARIHGRETLIWLGLAYSFINVVSL